MIVLAYANKHNASYHNFRNSLFKQGFSPKQITIIGKGEKWVDFMTKIRGYRNYLERVPPDEIVCIVDCFDVLACAGPVELQQKYTSFCDSQTGYFPIVFGAEDMCLYNCEPLTWWDYIKGRPDYGFRYLNSGFFIGRSRDIHSVLCEILGTDHTDDQLALCEYFNQHPEEIELDTTCQLVANITSTKHLQFENVHERVRNIETGQYPCFVHIPGMICDFMIRMNYYGSYILGKEYKFLPLTEMTNSMKPKTIVFALLGVISVIMFPLLFLVLIIVWLVYNRV